MNKKKFYISISAILIAIAVILLYFKVTKVDVKIEPVPESKTIIPTDYSKEKKQIVSDEEQLNNAASKVFLQLNSNEVILDVISVDLNDDGMEDQIIAVKKLLEPFLHLVCATQNPISHKWERIRDIKTGITEPKSLNFYTMQLSNSLPIIVYSGITSDNQQILSMQKTIKEEPLKFEEVISLNADIKIQIQELDAGEENELINFASFKIFTYDSDPNAPNTLNQVKTEYVWDYNTNTYEKGIATVIPGEKIENKLLKELKTGDIESIKDFLSGLWFKSIVQYSDRGRSFYFAKKDKNIIFNRENIQEIYEISSIHSLRYGLYIKANNKAIPNIIRIVRIEVKGVDEVQITVTENVRRIKTATKSLWTGRYKKSQTPAYTLSNKKTLNKELKNFFKKSKNEWINNKGFKALFNANKYYLEIYGKKESGSFNIIEVQNKIILQTRNEKDENTFYLVQFNQNKKKQNISLKKIKLNLNEIIETGEEEIILNREI